MTSASRERISTLSPALPPGATQTKPLWFHCRFHGTRVSGKVGTKFRAQSVGGGMRGSKRWPGDRAWSGGAAVSPPAACRSPCPGPGHERGWIGNLQITSLNLSQKPKAGRSLSCSPQEPMSDHMSVSTTLHWEGCIPKSSKGSIQFPVPYPFIFREAKISGGGSQCSHR